MGPKPNNRCPIRDPEMSDTHRGEAEVKMEAEVGSAASVSQGTPVISGKPHKLTENHGTDSPPESPEGIMSAYPLTVDFQQPPECKRINFYSFRLPSL